MTTNHAEPAAYEDKPVSAQIEDVETIHKPDNVVETYRSYPTDYRNEAERKLVRKVDKRLLPLVVIIYLFNYLDRNSITQARLYGLQKDTHVNGAVYQTAISIFSAGYIAMQLPSTMLMTKLRPSLYLVRDHNLENLMPRLTSCSHLVSLHGLLSVGAPALQILRPGYSPSDSSSE